MDASLYDDDVGLLLKNQALAFTSCGVSLSDARVAEMPLVYVNGGFERMTGYRQDECLGRNCRFLQRQDREQAALDELRAALRTGRHSRVILRNYRRDGSLFWNELTVSPIFDDEQRISHFVGIQTDVTDKERARRERESLVTELRAANRDLDDFAHIVSHDLRAPLRGVDTLCKILLEEHQEGLDAEGQRLVSLLDSRVQRLGALLQGVLRYSRARCEEAQWKQIDTGRLVRDVLDLLDLPSSLRIELADEMPVVRCDAVRLGQIFQNLIDNAAKFQLQEESPGSGGFIKIAAGRSEDRWHFSVADGGPGIPAEHQERIFGMFQTVRCRDQMETSGVGLAVVRKAVERLGGRIWVESEAGQGACFHFTLPVEPSEVAEPSEDTMRTDAARG